MESGPVVHREPDSGDSDPVDGLMRSHECVPPVPASPRRSKQRLGHPAGIVVQQDDPRTGHRKTFASAHDIRRGCTQRLIHREVAAETLQSSMRHSSFSTTEKHSGAMRSVQSAAAVVTDKLTNAKNSAFVGGKSAAPQLSAEELLKLTSLLNSR